MPSCGAPLLSELESIYSGFVGGGEAIDLDGLSTAAGAAAPPLAPTHGPAAETLHEGAEYDAKTGDAAEASEAAAAAGVRPPRPSNWGDMSRRQRQHWKLRSGIARWDSHGGGM